MDTIGRRTLLRRIKQIFPIVIIILIVNVFIFGIYGYYELLAPQGKFDFWGVLYSVLTMFIMDGAFALDGDNPLFKNWQLILASYLAAFVLGYGIFTIIYEYAHRAWIIFRIRFFFKNHTIILGAGQIGCKLALELLEENWQIVVIEKNEKNENIMKIRLAGGYVLIGSAFEEYDLIKAGISHASRCLIVVGNDENNIKAANLLTYLNQHKRISNHIKVQVQVRGWYNTSFLKDYMDVYNRTENFDMDTFNAHRAAAQVLFDDFSPLSKVQYKVFKENDKIVRIESSENAIALIGYNQTAEAFIVENIILSHSPGLRNLKVLLICKDAKKTLQNIKFKFAFIDQYLDIIPIELDSDNFSSENFNSEKFIKLLSQLSSAYLFGDEDAFLISLANGFRQLLYAKINDLNQIPIVVCLPEASQSLELLDPMIFQGASSKVDLFNDFKKHFNINILKVVTDTCTKEKLIDEVGIEEDLAKTVNYFYSMKYEFAWLLPESDRKLLTDKHLEKIEHIFLTKKFSTSNPLLELENAILEELESVLGKNKEELRKIFGIGQRWHALADIKQDSNRYVARHLNVKIGFLQKMGHETFERETIEKYFKVLAPIEHKRWCAEKLVYRFKFGEFPKDNASKKLLKDTLKIHDQLIPYEALDKEMEDKDFNMFLLVTVLQNIKLAQSKA